MASGIKVGIIGGTGMTNMELFKQDKVFEQDTPFGSPSSKLIAGSMNGVEVVILSRHGEKHSIMPTNVNYRANIYALKQAGCNVILATTACGSLMEEAKPGDFVVVDQFIDRTTKRVQTCYDGKIEGFNGVCHIPCSRPFCDTLRKVLKQSCDNNGVACHYGGSVVTIEGPRFSSYAESLVFKSWGAKVINMTMVPEVVIANELGLPYASIAMVTDYDCWKNEGNDGVNVENVMATMKTNRENALKVLVSAVGLVVDNQKEIEEAVQKSKVVAAGSVM